MVVCPVLWDYIGLQPCLAGITRIAVETAIALGRIKWGHAVGHVRYLPALYAPQSKLRGGICMPVALSAAGSTHWLLTSPGVNRVPTLYALDGRTAEAELAPVPLLQLLPAERRPQRILALTTKEATEKTLGYLTRASECPVTPVHIPNGSTPKEVWEILSRLLGAVPAGIHLTLDVTHGFRSLPFIYVTSALFLTTLRQVNIQGIYYGMLEARSKAGPLQPQAPVPFVDLSVVLELAEWFYATRIFRETGLATALTELLLAGGSERGSHALLIGALEQFAQAYAAGLPLELGWAASALDREAALAGPVAGIPAGRELLQVLLDAARPFRLHDGENKPHIEQAVDRPGSRRRPSFDDSAKRSITLDLNELQREAELIDLYLSRYQFATAIQLIREWMVNRVILACQSENLAGASMWLKPVDRGVAERRLSALQYVPSEFLTTQQRETRQWWQSLSNRRNEVAHCGFRSEPVAAHTRLRRVRELWSRVLAHAESAPHWQLRLSDAEGQLLASPVGRARGALYTALRALSPDLLLPIVSCESAGLVDEICTHAGFGGERLPPLVMEDPYAGYSEITTLVGSRSVEPQLGRSLLRAGEVVVNLTGGTTVMQHLAHRVAEIAADHFNLPTCTVAVVDRRAPAEQKSDPYREGEVVKLKRYG